MSASTKSFLGAVLIAVLLGPATPLAHGQALAVEYGVTRAGYDDVLERPRGFGGRLDLPFNDRLSLRLAVAHRTETLSIRRSPCTGLVAPGTDCSPERFRGNAQLTTYGAGLAALLPRPAPNLRPELYALIIGARIDATFRSRTSETRLEPITPDGLSGGIAAGGSLRYAVTPYFGLFGHLGAKVVYFDACGADGWFAFCQSRFMPQVGVGMEVHVP